MLNGRVLVITGAGVSAESGIPTFRGKDGYWRNWDPAKLATPTAFQNDPDLAKVITGWSILTTEANPHSATESGARSYREIGRNGGRISARDAER